MTMRTYTYYVCPNGHHGHELLSENDQPYSKMWERTTTEGIVGRLGADGATFYVCSKCDQPVTETGLAGCSGLAG